MKRISIVLAILSLVITACILYLVFSGISLRSSPLIQPSVINSDRSNIAKSLILRLFQEMQNTHYVLWGVLPENDESNSIITQAADEYEKTFHKTVQFIRDGENADLEYLKACNQPCWIFLPKAKAHQLENNDFVQKMISLDRRYISISLLFFQKNVPVSDECGYQKRLNFECLYSVSIRSVQKKMKDPEKRYFFLQKYNDLDYFLFIQQNL